jgi:putative endonuclease
MHLARAHFTRQDGLASDGAALARPRRMAISQHCALGKSGEDLACDELLRRGYAIVDRRYRTQAGEIDVVARDGAALVFVEVKTRRSTRCGMPVDAVTPRKRRQIVLMASDYLARRRPHARSCRFDVVAVAVDRDGRAAITVIPGAFRADE